MADQSAIQWCDATHNEWEGCEKVSPGCDNCYAEVRNARFGGGVAPNWGPGAPRRLTSEANRRKPLAWNAQPFVECMACHWRGEARAAARVANQLAGFHPPADSALVCPACHEPQLKAARRRVFCSSLADVFDNAVPPIWRANLFATIKATPNLDWLLLTKRIGNGWKMMADACGVSQASLTLPLHNVWLGATMVNQAEYDRDVRKLLAVDASVRFLSVEPMLGPISGGLDLHGLDWVIVGGESGAKARPIQREWIDSLRRECEAARVAFFFKQWGGPSAAAGGCALDGAEAKEWPCAA